MAVNLQKQGQHPIFTQDRQKGIRDIQKMNKVIAREIKVTAKETEMVIHLLDSIAIGDHPQITC